MFNYLPFGAISAAVGIALAAYHLHIYFLLFLLIILLFSLLKRIPQLFLMVSLCGTAYTLIFTIHTSFEVDQPAQERFLSGPVVIESIPKIDGNRLSATVSIDDERLAAFYTIQTEHEKELLKAVEPGMSCHVTGEVRPPKHATIPNGFPYDQFLKTKNINAIFLPQSIKSCTKKDHPSYYLQVMRQKGLKFLEEHVPKNSVGIVQALIFGDREFIDPDTLRDYQMLGMIHLLAISGLHVQTLLACLFWCLLRVGITRETARILLLCFLPVYACLTGAAPSVLRACLMAGIYLLMTSLSKEKKQPSAVVLSATFLLLLAIHPLYLFDIGFQLSFVVTFFIVLSANILSKVKSAVMQLFLISFVAQLASLPVLLYHFQQFSLLGIPMNMIYVPFYTVVVLPFSLLFFLLSIVYLPLGQTLFQLLDSAIWCSHQLSAQIAVFDGFTFIFMKSAWWHILLEVVAIVVLLFVMECKASAASYAVPTLFLIGVLSVHFFTPNVLQKGEVTMLDVGQGDSLFIQLPHRKGHLLVDTGGRLSFEEEPWKKRRKVSTIGDQTLIPFLHSKGIAKLDMLILTHADQDHMGEAIRLIRRNKVKRLAISKGFARSKEDAKLLKEAAEKGIIIDELERGDQLRVGEHIFEVLHPSQDRVTSKNNDSLVLTFTLGGKRFLLTGDLEQEGERDIIDAYPHLRADVLKVGHHGSKGSTSEEWLEHLKPSHALISAGERNRYQHPHQEVLENLKAHETKVYRTDRDGSVTFEFLEEEGTFYTHPPYDILQNQ
ncbi:DNA internalization-related competence protein ComEC/Rec2 [Bacillus pumilus]|uniref:DNA internalization-related competence protein ComEC/Rec2 n=1 Tax=Bacillus pumilus TaxID=1408 RepID=UPI0011E9896D|nr:DNA internalization-related competence protein ComEC/Rec2 [Bacillus pumilus]TYS36797.1 DNA internalization-related competence protein ComEC/Rec2 [Bacillus pumilus]TYS53602.1 DNA internalization-related competence protein ComEC/Rec2 [Bacillus pumilus]